MYDIETGQTETTHYVGTDGSNEQQTYTWSQKVSAKISLMYLHDVAYAYANCSSDECSSRGNPGSATNVKNSWIHFQKDGYNSSPSEEWLSTRWGGCSASCWNVYARLMGDGGGCDSHSLQGTYGARPVFYLSSGAEIADGDGTKENPFILDVQGT